CLRRKGSGEPAKTRGEICTEPCASYWRRGATPRMSETTNNQSIPHDHAEVTIGDCEIVGATGKALCVKFGDGIDQWMPRSQLRDKSISELHARGDLVISEWWQQQLKRKRESPQSQQPGARVAFPVLDKRDPSDPDYSGTINLGG